RTRGGAYGAGVSNPLVQTKAGGAALDLGFYNGGHHSWGYEGKAVHALFSPATLGPGPGEDDSFWDDSANPENPGGPLGPPIAEDHDLAGQTAALGLGVPNWVHWKYGAGGGGSLETYKGLGSDVIRMLANQQADTIMAANGNLGIFVTIDGQRQLVEYEWIPPTYNYNYGFETSPGRYVYKEVYSGYSTGAIGQDPGAEADSKYLQANVMLYGGLGGIAISAPGAVAASAASGLTGVFTWGAAEVTSALTGLPIPTPGGAARSTAKNFAETAAEQLAKSADEMQDVAEGIADALRNAPSSAVDSAIAAMGKRLQRLGYDEANATRIMNSIANGEQVVIVGEKMSRVQAVARMVKSAGGEAVTYAPRSFTGLNKNTMEANRSWIRYWAKTKETPVNDLGRQPTIRPDGPSPFYGMENRSLHRWGVYTPF
ncbi:MAG: hypothetical protein ACK57U_15705, partial [Planctomycetota bacterium]